MTEETHPPEAVAVKTTVPAADSLCGDGLDAATLSVETA